MAIVSTKQVIEVIFYLIFFKKGFISKDRNTIKKLFLLIQQELKNQNCDILHSLYADPDKRELNPMKILIDSNNIHGIFQYKCKEEHFIIPAKEMPNLRSLMDSFGQDIVKNLDLATDRAWVKWKEDEIRRGHRH